MLALNRRLYPCVLVCIFSSFPIWAGDLSDRFQLSLERVLRGGPPEYTLDFVLADAVPRHGRRFTNFSGDVSGRYLDALAAAASFLNVAPFPQLEETAAALPALQRPDGHFGDPFHLTEPQDDDMAVLWGNGRLLIGLLEYHALTGDEKSLEAARKLAEFLLAAAATLNSADIQEVFSRGKFAVGYICWTQQIEGLVKIFEYTRDSRFLDLAQAVAARTRREPRQHSHGFLTSLRGILALYRVTGETRYLEQVREAWDEIIRSGNRLITGAVPEMLDAVGHRTEGCSEADWLRLNLELWELTREQPFLEEAERTLFNEFSFNQFAGGDFGHYELRTGEGREAQDTLPPTGYGPWSARAWWCCTLHGLRAFPEVMKRVLRMEQGRRIVLDLPTDGRWRQGAEEIVSESHFNRDAGVTVELKSTAEVSSLAVRLPRWADAVEARLDDRLLTATRDGGYVVFQGPFAQGDSIEVSWKLRTLRHAQESEGRRYIALQHGPWILGVDQLTSTNFFDEPFPENRLLLSDTEPPYLPRPQFGALAEAGRFAVPIAHFVVPYRPGGYPEAAQYTFLHPLAERTAQSGPATWLFWFQPGLANQPDIPQTDWVQLFNGRDLSGWIPKITGYETGDNFGDTFRVEDGLLTVAYDAYDRFDDRFGVLFYEAPFSHYRLAVEYRFVGEQLPGGPDWAFRNSGIMIHSQDPRTMLRDQDFPISIEVQLLGGRDSGERPTANLCTPGTHVEMNGELVTQHCINSLSPTFRGDRWVRVEVEVLGSDRITHIVEGLPVISYEKPQIGGGQVNQYDPAVKEDGRLLESGFIALQSESHPIQFRKVELLNLEGCLDPKASNFRSYYRKPNNAACRYD